MSKHVPKEALPGFPTEFTFQSKEEVDDYFSGDKIQCLRCGHYYRALAAHLRLAHAMHVDEYRAIYGLPWSIGLSGKATKKKRAKYANRRNAEFGCCLPDLEDNPAYTSNNRRREPEYVTKEARKRFKDMNKILGRDGSKGAAKRANTPKFGSKEYHEKMKRLGKLRRFKMADVVNGVTPVSGEGSTRRRTMSESRIVCIIPKSDVDRGITQEFIRKMFPHLVGLTFETMGRGELAVSAVGLSDHNILIARGTVIGAQKALRIIEEQS